MATRDISGENATLIMTHFGLNAAAPQPSGVFRSHYKLGLERIIPVETSSALAWACWSASCCSRQRTLRLPRGSKSRKSGDVVGRRSASSMPRQSRKHRSSHRRRQLRKRRWALATLHATLLHEAFARRVWTSRRRIAFPLFAEPHANSTLSRLCHLLAHRCRLRTCL